MKTNTVIGSVEFLLGSTLKPWGGEPTEYVIEIEGAINVSLDDDDVIAGKIELALIKFAEAQDDGVNVYQLFDGYSADLEEAYGAFFDSKGRFRKRHRIDRSLVDLLFIRSIALHADCDRRILLGQAVETAIAVLSPMSLAFGYAKTLNQHGLLWQQHGFKSAGGAGIIFRDNLDFEPVEMATWTRPDHAH